MPELSSSSTASVLERTRAPLTPLEWSFATSVSKLQNWLAAQTPQWMAPALGLVLPKARHIDDFIMQYQCYSLWCWAAVAASVGALSQDNSNHKKQCVIANDQLQAEHGNCCAATCQIVGLPYDVFGSMNQALDFVHCRKGMFAEKPELEKIKEQILGKNPVCVHIQWKDFPGHFHFVAICGFGPDDYVTIKDPAYGNGNPYTLKYGNFPDHFHGGASWEHTYFTKRT